MCIPTCGQVIGRILCFQDFNPGLTGEAMDSLLDVEFPPGWPWIMCSLFALDPWAATTGYHRLGGLWTTKAYFPQFWRLESQIMAPASSAHWWELTGWFTGGRLLALSPHRRGERKLRVSFLGAPIPFMKALITSQNASPPNTLGIGFGGRGTQTFSL